MLVLNVPSGAARSLEGALSPSQAPLFGRGGIGGPATALRRFDCLFRGGCPLLHCGVSLHLVRGLINFAKAFHDRARAVPAPVRSARLWKGALPCASNQRHGRSKAGEDVIRADRSKRAAQPASPGPEALPPGSLRAGRKGRSSGTARDGRPPRSPKGTRNLRIEHGSAPFHNRALRTGAGTARARSWKALAKLINPRTRWRETQPADPGSAGSVDSRERLPTLGAATTAPPLRRQEAGSRKSRRRPRVAPEGAPLGPMDARPEHPSGGFTHPSSITGSA